MTSRVAPISEPGAQSARPARRRLNYSFLGVLPFFLFTILALLIPIGFLIIGSFQDTNNGDALTLKNYSDLVTDSSIISAYGTSIEISIVTAIAGAIFGFLLAYAVILGGLPGFLRTALMTFSGVASNFAGVPLALAFIFTLGSLGLVTSWLKAFGINIYAGGFNLLTKTGLELVYMYFQFPLMVLIIAPAIDGLKKEWREASENMGASPRQYWQYVALPILLPSILGATILLFGNSIGAQATAYQLTGGTLPLVTVLIGAQMSGDVLHNDGLGYALAMGLVLIMGIAIVAYSILQRRSERWLRR
ncbi:MAG TPA: ABC transporter permease subunit [Candidatus Limnocylindrales bacterium]|nr:ABC transporter permease subunit [Candidatus Limnocylindrales bacterium]